MAQTKADETENENEVAVVASDLKGEGVDIQIATAKRYGRSLTKFLKKAEAMATLDEDIAGSCHYALKRRNKDGTTKIIEGPSARFAEIIINAWGNMRAEAKMIDESDRYVTSRGMSWDLESNVAIAYEVRRRITDSNGQRYGDDMVDVTANAANSIALRNAVLKVVPQPVWKPIYDAAMTVAVGTASTLVDRRTKAIESFRAVGIKPDKLFAWLEVKGEEEITLEHLGILTGIRTSVKEGETTYEKVFSEPRETGNLNVSKGATKLDTLGETMKQTSEASNGGNGDQSKTDHQSSEQTGNPPQDKTPAGERPRGKLF